jgi:hypothetical protein
LWALLGAGLLFVALWFVPIFVVFRKLSVMRKEEE